MPLREELDFFCSELDRDYTQLLLSVYINGERDIEAVETQPRSDSYRGIIHITNVLSNANMILSQTKDFKISSHQRLLLGCAILLHDIGRVRNNENHAEVSARMVVDNHNKYFSNNSILFAEAVSDIIRSHSHIIVKDVKPRYIDYFGVSVSLPICFTILRLADELDCTLDRTHPVMKESSLKVRVRNATLGVKLHQRPDNADGLIEIITRPTDICVWNWIPKYERHLQSIIMNEIYPTGFNYYRNLIITRENGALRDNSFWAKLIDIEGYENMDIVFIFGIVVSNNRKSIAPKYGKQPTWKGSPYSIWDIKSMISLHHMAMSINTNANIKMEHVFMDKNIKRNLDHYIGHLEAGTNFVLGSPKMNALSEYLFAEAFGVEPFAYEKYKSQDLLRFSWPVEDTENKSRNRIPLSTFLYQQDAENFDEKGIYRGTARVSNLLVKTVFPKNYTEIQPDYGLILIMKINSRYHVVLAGTSGPGTLAASSILCDCTKCYLLEKQEILAYLDKGAVFVLINTMILKNSSDEFMDRKIDSSDICNAWYYDREEQKLNDINLDKENKH